MYFPRTPHIARFIYPNLTWRIREKKKSIYITFDDGPDPVVTPAVLNLLDKYNAKATFFCVGEKVEQNREVYSSLLSKGHAVGNHSFNHLNGKDTPLEEYTENIHKATELIESDLFRPPYGKITTKQVKVLRNSYKIIMWSVLPGDFDSRLSQEMVLNRAIRYTQKGSIVVFHDNIKFQKKMMHALEGLLIHFSKKGYQFNAIESHMI